ncbi:YraN family protein [Candidatus Woesebacteria bacterium]|nr:YraN family protein [Candidatus Woesebacteria bacterium]
MFHPQRAEQCMATLLERKGWFILCKNFRCVGSEIDLIAHKRKTIIFVEVKLRRQTPKKGRDLEQLLPSSKKKALRRGAHKFLSMYEEKLPLWENLRFDLAIISQPSSEKKASLQYFVDILAQI